MPYRAEKPPLAETPEQLRARIPGWGADLDPADRPSYPRERTDLPTGAHWDFPERQIPRYPRERSTEHKFLTPVFGTVCPPKGLSGVIRRFAYTLSEGRLAHWQLLVLADRIDVIESRIGALLQLRPDFLFTQAGLRAEIKHGGLRSRIGQRRADTKHLPVDVLLFTGTTLVMVGALAAVGIGVAKLLPLARRRRGLRRLLG